MSEKGIDIFGIKPIGEAVNKITTGAVEGAGAFLSRICLPAAEEFGLLLRDRVHDWRTRNVVNVAEIAERKLNASGASTGVHAHPRLVNEILDQGSWIGDCEVQEMWAGLLASSCTESGDDDSNLLFVNLLAGLSRIQAKILKFACENAKKSASPEGLIVSNEELSITPGQLIHLAGTDDIQRLDRELDHLRALELLSPNTGFVYGDASVMLLTPTALALHLYVRCQGVRISPVDYFQIQPEPAAEPVPPPPSQHERLRTKRNRGPKRVLPSL